MEEEKQETSELTRSENIKSVTSDREENKYTSEDFDDENHHSAKPAVMVKQSDKFLAKYNMSESKKLDKEVNGLHKNNDINNVLSSSNLDNESQQVSHKKYSSGVVSLKNREAHNSSSPNKNMKKDKIDQLKLRTHDYFHRGAKNNDLNKDLRKSTDKDSPRFIGEKSHTHESANSLSGDRQDRQRQSSSQTNVRDEITEYTKEEMHGFQTVFNTFDKENNGHVFVKDLQSIFVSLRRDPNELGTILDNLGMNHLQDQDQLAFDVFVQIMQQLENEMDKTQDDQEDQDEVYSKQLEIQQFGEDDVKSPYIDVVRKDHNAVPMNQHYFTAGEDEQEEPQPARFEMIDESQKSESQLQQEPQHLLKHEQTEEGTQHDNNSYKTSSHIIHENEGTEEDEEMEEIQETQTDERTSNNSSTYSYKCPASPTAHERKLYGSMLPRQGVYFLPDLKVIDFIRVLHNYKRQCLKEGKLTEVKRSKNKINELRNKEMLRQLSNMCVSHEKEVTTVEKAQRKQFAGFEKAWDSYMMEYEMGAQKSVVKLQKHQEKELRTFKQIKSRETGFKIVYSQDLIMLR